MRFRSVFAVPIISLILAVMPVAEQQNNSPGLKMSPAEVARALGVAGAPAGVNPVAWSKMVAAGAAPGQAAVTTAGLPVNMSSSSAFSTAVMTAVGQGVNLLGDWDGQEDLVADHSGLVANMLAPGVAVTRTAISEHTMANGFPENIFYYADSVGNFTVAASTSLTTASPTPTTLLVNLPTVLNAFGPLNSNSQIVITGIAVSPVCDLTSFGNVNGSFAGFNGLIGEILYVSFWDTGGGFRLASNGQLVQSGVLAFPVADTVSPAAAPPATLSNTGFPVTVGGAFGVAFSLFSNLAGLAVDDDGNVYFQQVDLIHFTGANIVKIAATGTNQDRSLATGGLQTLTTLNPLNGRYGTASGPASQVDTYTNYSGTSTTFGNITALAAGPGNVLYAAVARSFVATDDAATQATEGLFAAPLALSATPSMVISFADCAGGVDACSGLVGATFVTPERSGFGQPPPAGILPVADGIADVAAPGLTLSAGVNNFRAFVLGDGPDMRLPVGVPSPVFGNVDNTQSVSFQVDYTIYAGLTVDEEGSVYLVSGGTPAGVGRNPSPNLGEVLVFPDALPADRRADYIDLRGHVVPTPTASAAGNVGDGLSDRYDHIFWQAPLDQMTVTPAGISGLTRGFLLYLNRTRTADNTPTLPNGAAQGNGTTSGPVSFETLDPGHQVAGGDDQNFPFTGDDNDGAGNPAEPGPLNGGFEFSFMNGSGGSSVWNAFFLNSDGNVTFGAGDTSGSPTVSTLVAGAPRIAGAWANLNPGSRAGAFLNTFPVQAVGFAGINHFEIRWINVPEAGNEACGSRNTFSISLYDDGTGVDENANQPLNPANPIGNNSVPFDLREGPTASRFAIDSVTGQLAGRPPRPDGSGEFTLTYGRMDLLGTAASPVLVGYAIGGLVPGAANQDARNLSLQSSALIGSGLQTAIYEFFNTGSSGPSAVPSFDLRFEGNSTAMCSPLMQPDPNRGTLTFFGKSGFNVVVAIPPVPHKLGDFDGDHHTDVAVYRPSSRVWYTILSSTLGLQSTQWGGPGDLPVPGDYDGDGKTDLAVWRPSAGEWFITPSSGAPAYGYVWGAAGDVPVPGDYDGDGKTDLAVWRPSQGKWYIVRSSDGSTQAVSWGTPGDIPLVGDFDGDHNTDLAVFRPSNGTFYVLPSSGGGMTSYSVQWGTSGDVPVVGDFDGDGKSDLAVFRPDTNTWYVINSSTSTITTASWGTFGDIPVIGDFDGDGKTDFAVFRPSTATWYVIKSGGGGTMIVGWGTNGDDPV
jgi:hypothetical protein